MIPWLLCGILFVLVLLLFSRLWLLRRAVNEIRAELEEILSRDTNILISLSSGARSARQLAASLNEQLRLLREQRRRYLNGDRELREAVTNISHDLRTPITAIRGYLDLLEREEQSEAVSRYLSFIENRVQALTQLTEELFRYSVAVSEPDRDAYAPISLNAALEESVAAYYAALTERGITPDIKMPGGAVIRKLDKSALSRVFGNILNNAVKYSDGDLEITLDEAGEIVFSNLAPGLGEVQAGMLFNRFYTVHTARNSTGLGLAISRTLVERMNGNMTAEYVHGKLRIRVGFQIERP